MSNKKLDAQSAEMSDVNEVIAFKETYIEHFGENAYLAFCQMDKPLDDSMLAMKFFKAGFHKAQTLSKVSLPTNEQMLLELDKKPGAWHIGVEETRAAYRHGFRDCYGWLRSKLGGQ